MNVQLSGVDDIFQPGDGNSCHLLAGARRLLCYHRLERPPDQPVVVDAGVLA